MMVFKDAEKLELSMTCERGLTAMVLEEEEDDLLIYRMSEGATGIFKKRKDEDTSPLC